MDKRHVYLMHEILKCWPFEHALELGCFNGASSTAFIEAMNAGAAFDLVLCDVMITESVVEVAKSCLHPQRVRVTPQPSWTVLNSPLPFDFIFVDAAHDYDSVHLEVTKLQRRINAGFAPVCLMAHDTSATKAGMPRCEGAEYLGEYFRNKPDWYCIEDNKFREGEHTERGLFLATQSKELFAKVEELWKQYI